MSTYFKGNRIRLYPTAEQEQKLWQHIGCCRFVWNYMLNMQKERHEKGEGFMSAYDMIKTLPSLKHGEDYAWLCDVSNTSLQKACTSLAKAYKDFFNKSKGYPKYKSRKKSKPKYQVREEHLRFDGKTAHIEKVGKVRYKTDLDIPLGKSAKFASASISYDDHKWFLSFAYECESQAFELTDKDMGIDLGVRELAVVSFGDDELRYANINRSMQMKKLDEKIRHTQRSISRKYEANKAGNKYVKTENIAREEEKLRKLWHRKRGIRMNYLHQTTHELVSMLPRRIVMEDLEVQKMLQTSYLAKDIQDECFYEFRRQVEYKCKKMGIEFVKADKAYPSSARCSGCGNVRDDLSLGNRTYVCPVCGLKIDRDLNAAINLKEYRENIVNIK